MRGQRVQHGNVRRISRAGYLLDGCHKPPVGGAFYYLIRAGNGCGRGSPSRRSSGEERTALAWPEETAAKRTGGVYNLYRDDAPFLCDIAGTTANDAGEPPSGVHYSYLVTAENNLAEEGTKGSGSDGNERSNLDACP